MQDAVVRTIASALRDLKCCDTIVMVVPKTNMSPRPMPTPWARKTWV